jgi:hypothetical protein
VAPPEPCARCGKPILWGDEHCRCDERGCSISLTIGEDVAPPRLWLTGNGTWDSSGARVSLAMMRADYLNEFGPDGYGKEDFIAFVATQLADQDRDSALMRAPEPSGPRSPSEVLAGAEETLLTLLQHGPRPALLVRPRPALLAYAGQELAAFVQNVRDLQANTDAVRGFFWHHNANELAQLEQVAKWMIATALSEGP